MCVCRGGASKCYSFSHAAGVGVVLTWALPFKRGGGGGEHTTF